MSRPELQRRQEAVLAALLRGEVPDGFDPRSAGLTVRVLRTKRRSDALEAVPALADVEHLAERFDRWAAAHPRTGCAHDDVVDFVAGDHGPLPEPFASIRQVERVYRRQARWGRDRRAGSRPWVLAAGARVWHLGPRVAPTSPPAASALVSE